MRWTRLALTALLLATSAATSLAGEATQLILRDRRVASGRIVRAETDDRVWLVTLENGIELRSAFRWHDIASVVHESKQHSPSAFRSLIDEGLPSPPPAPVQRSMDAVLGSSLMSAAPRAHFIAEPLPPVRSLQLRAWGANWDDDPEQDGLLVQITPLTARGEFVPAEGLLAMTLIGESSQGDVEQPRRFRHRYPEITRETVPVHPDDFVFGPATYQLPYRNVFPEARLDLFPQGVVTVSLGVAEQGNITASTEVSLVAPSFLRDRRQQWFGERFFRQEHSRLPRDPFVPDRSIWLTER
jgi:hypothetical protein